MPEKGHTQDLVLAFGLSVSISELCDTHILDHLLVRFTVTLPLSQVKSHTLVLPVLDLSFDDLSF